MGENEVVADRAGLGNIAGSSAVAGADGCASLGEVAALSNCTGPDEGMGPGTALSGGAHARPSAGRTRSPGLLIELVARARATTLEGWRAFISADPSELALLTRRRWEGLGERDRRDYDEARIVHHAELVVVTTSAISEITSEGQLLVLMNQQTTAPPTPSSRSRYTPTPPGSPHASSGSTAPATAPRPDAPVPGLSWRGRFSSRAGDLASLSRSG